MQGTQRSEERPAAATGARPPVQMLNADGELLVPEAELAGIPLLELFRQLVRTRAFDDRAMHLQRSGQIPYYYSCAGQEAHAAIPFALRREDWLFIAYREQGVRLARGVSVEQELALFAGKLHACWRPREHRITPLAATIGTHIPHAVGHGYASRLNGRDEVSLAIFGDGATSEGDFHAGLNFAGVWRAPTIFFCQNNLYAQSTPLRLQTAAASLAEKAAAYGIEGARVDGMDALAVFQEVRRAAERARAGAGPTLIEALCYRYQAHSTYDGTPVYRTREEEAQWRAKDPILRLRIHLQRQGLLPDGFEQQVREATIAEVDAAMQALNAKPLPSRRQVFASLHAKMPARLEEQLHEQQRIAGEPPSALPEREKFIPAPETEASGETRAMTLAEALNTELKFAMTADPALVVLGEDVGREGGVFRVTQGLFDAFGEQRVIDTPLSELGIVGTAVGMAMGGLRPVCEIEFAGFAFTAFDQIAFHVARYRWRSQGEFPMPLVIRLPGGGGHEGLEGHSDSPEALFAHVPGLAVVYPSNPKDAKGLLAASLKSEDPVIFLEPIARYFSRQPEVPVQHYELPIGKARVCRPGEDLTILSYGNAMRAAEEAAEALAAEGISPECIDLRTLKPWDEACVLDSVRKTGRLVVVHEANKSGGLGAEILATVAEKAVDYLEAPPVRVAHADLVWAPAKLEPYSTIGPERILAAARAVLGE